MSVTTKQSVSERTIGRLALYRRLLTVALDQGEENLFSRQLAEMSGNSAAQVRRDLMVVGYDGSTTRGYSVRELLQSLSRYLDRPGGEPVALIGIGNLGRALMTYFTGRRPNLRIVAGFDVDPYRHGRVIHGCRCHPMDSLAEVIAEQGIRVAILAVPGREAQAAADAAVRAGVQGILNFAPVPLHLPGHIHVESIDLTMSLEKVAYFSRNEPDVEKGE